MKVAPCLAVLAASVTFACSLGCSRPDLTPVDAAVAIEAHMSRSLYKASAEGAAIPGTVESVIVEWCRQDEAATHVCLAEIRVSTRSPARRPVTKSLFVLKKTPDGWAATTDSAKPEDQ